MNLSFACSAARIALTISRPVSPASLRARASVPASIVWESCLSSCALRSGTIPISFKYCPTESLIFSLFLIAL